MQQLAVTPRISAFRPCWFLLAFANLVLLGCNRDAPTSYVATKETVPAPSTSTKTSAGGLTLLPGSWTIPAGWQEQPAGGMRIASFTVTNNDQKAEISIIPLAGSSGGELANVNRWRNQVGLEPIDASKLEAAGEKVSIGGQPAALYDIVGTDPQTKQPTRILAAGLSSGGTTWFFKMLGGENLVGAQKPAFKEFLQSVKFQSGSAPEAMSQAQPPMPQAMPPGHPGVEAASGKPTWEVPNGWQEQAPSSMRVATFHVTGDGTAKADMAVTKLAGTAGGNLANVNRWRSQLGLEPVDEAGLEKLVTTHEVNGTKILIVDMAGQSVESGVPARLLAAIVPLSGATWFYKMVGDDKLVEGQKAAFIKFVESARYPNVS